MVMEPLKDNYGDAVAVNYFDINDDELDPNIKQFFATHDYPFPLTFINGQAVSAGYISYFDLSGKIAEIIKGGTHQ